MRNKENMRDASDRRDMSSYMSPVSMCIIPDICEYIPMYVYKLPVTMYVLTLVLVSSPL